MNARVQDAYPLAPGQAGMLFDSLAATRPGVYVLQLLIEARGAVDPDRWRASWAALTARHDALRTAFVWRDRRQPLQVVGRAARMETGEHDLSALGAAAQAERFAEWLRADRARGFELSRAPLMRAHLFRLGDARLRVVVSFHHLALDGWSVPALLREWGALYAGRALPSAPPFRAFIDWARAQDSTAARAFWRNELAQESAAMWNLPAPAEPPASPPADPRGETALSLSPQERAALEAAGRARGFTLAMAVAGCWLFAQARAGGAKAALCGLARALRPAATPGAEARIGMHLNTLPLRAALEEDRPAADWLAALQRARLAQAPHEHLGLAEALAGSGARAAAGFDSAVAFENYPSDPAALGSIPGLTLERIEAREQTGLKLTLFATLQDGLTLRLVYDAASVDGAAARLALEDAARALRAVAARPDALLADVETRCRAARPAPAPTPVAAAAAAAEGAPVAALAQIWAAVLETDAPEPNDNFFDLGGHSLLALSLKERIRRDLGVEVEIPDLFSAATLGAQAALLARLQAGDAPDQAAPTADRAEGRAEGRARLRRRARTQTQTLQAEASERA